MYQWILNFILFFSYSYISKNILPKINPSLGSNKLFFFSKLKYLFKTSEIIELTIGEPNQKIKAKLDIKDFSFHLVQKINDINYYSQNISKTRVFERNTTYSFYDSQFSEGYVIKDNFFYVAQKYFIYRLIKDSLETLSEKLGQKISQKIVTFFTLCSIILS